MSATRRDSGGKAVPGGSRLVVGVVLALLCGIGGLTARAAASPTTGSRSVSGTGGRTWALPSVFGASSVPSPSAPATTTTSSSSATPTIQAANGQLMLGGQVYRFVGLNAYELATDWGVNAGCGAMLDDGQLNTFFASLPPNSLVRLWAWQGTIATNYTTHVVDWRPLDRVMNAAAANHQRVILSLAGQGGDCDNFHWQDPSWYEGGYNQVFNDPATTDGRGLTPLSYADYVRQIVSRYSSSPALGMWEPISEAEASTCPAPYQPKDCEGHQICPDEHAAAVALRSFFDAVGGMIHQLDPAHLVESGTLGSGQCGTTWEDFPYVSASPGLDVLSYHDYYPAGEVLGGDQWNGLAVHLAQARQLGKPIIGGESGEVAGTTPGCPSPSARAADLGARIQGQLAAGSSGVLIWDWMPVPPTTCTYDTYPGDPLLSSLAGYLSAN